jgi:uncharacterized protein
MTMAYVDASALVKLVLDEPDAAPMRRWYIESDRIATSQIGAIETRRAVARKLGPEDRVETILRSVSVVAIDPSIARAAATLPPSSLRTLAAIHLATALGLQGEIDAFVTYDDRLAEAARSLGLPVMRPA